MYDSADKLSGSSRVCSSCENRSINCTHWLFHLCSFDPNASFDASITPASGNWTYLFRRILLCIFDCCSFDVMLSFHRIFWISFSFFALRVVWRYEIKHTSYKENQNGEDTFWTFQMSNYLSKNLVKIEGHDLKRKEKKILLPLFHLSFEDICRLN